MKTTTLIILFYFASQQYVSAHEKRDIINQCQNEQLVAEISFTPAAIRMLNFNHVNLDQAPMAYSKLDDFRGVTREEQKNPVCDDGTLTRSCGFIDDHDSLSRDHYSVSLEAALNACSQFYINDSPRVSAKPNILAPASFLNDKLDPETGIAFHHSLYKVSQGLIFQCVICLDEIERTEQFFRRKN